MDEMSKVFEDVAANFTLAHAAAYPIEDLAAIRARPISRRPTENRFASDSSSP
jgi:hypothetical protein